MKHPDPLSKPSELIRLALRDLRSVERSKKYKVDMDCWHEPDVDASLLPTCRVCLAGAVMARSLKIPKDEFCLGTSDDVGPEWSIRIGALNSLRQGNLRNAGLHWGACESLKEWRHIPEYAEDPSAFHLAMEALAAEYEAVGA